MSERGVSDGWIIALYGIGAVLSMVLIGVGFTSGPDVFIACGVIGLVLTLALLPICLFLRARIDRDEQADNIQKGLHNLRDAIELLQENIVLSDDARRVLNRKKEGTLLRAAIEEDIRTGDFDAAMVLVRELAERFGYRNDAESFRSRIEAARSGTVHTEINNAIASLDAMIAECRWDEAFTEASRITRVYHESHAAEGLRHRVEAARMRYKEDLERRFLQAAHAGEAEQAMGLLREMDAYHSEQESERFLEVARGVIGQARENLGAQFKLAIHDKAWDNAEEVGQRIIEEFPNTRMAEEVRAMIDTIRERARSISR
jgi:tetratricopeptide (TPR) repeat protein